MFIPDIAMFLRHACLRSSIRLPPSPQRKGEMLQPDVLKMHRSTLNTIRPWGRAHSGEFSKAHDSRNCQTLLGPQQSWGGCNGLTTELRTWHGSGLEST